MLYMLHILLEENLIFFVKKLKLVDHRLLIKTQVGMENSKLITKNVL